MAALFVLGVLAAALLIGTGMALLIMTVHGRRGAEGFPLFPFYTEESNNGVEFTICSLVYDGKNKRNFSYMIQRARMMTAWQ